MTSVATGNNNRPLYRAEYQVGRGQDWVRLSFPPRDVALTTLLRSIRRHQWTPEPHMFLIPLDEAIWPTVERVILQHGFAMDDKLRDKIAARREAREATEKAQRKERIKKGGKT